MSQHLADASDALRAFVEANARQDEDGMRACLTRGTLEAGGFSGATPDTVRFELDDPDPASTPERVVIPLRVVSVEAPADAPPLDTLRCVMVPEEGRWKFDLLATMQPAMEAMDQAMNALGEAMSEAMGAVGEAISEALGGADDQPLSLYTGEPLAPSSYEDAPDMPTDQEWVPIPELHTLTGVTALVAEAVAPALGRDIPIRADLASLLGLFGADDPTQLIPWLDAEFTRGLDSALELATRAVPRAMARLRSVRIEASLEWMERSICLDGPDLVYRADLRDTQGWYSPDELAYNIAGVVAGVPEQPERYPASMGSLPTREPLPTLDVLRRVRTPREMRRLCAALGNPVALDIDWDAMWSGDQIIRNWCVWGVSRVLGAVRLAYPEGEAVPEGLIRLIRIAPTSVDRRASLVDGVLEIQCNLHHPSTHCFYEHELCAVLMGQAIEPPAE